MTSEWRRVKISEIIEIIGGGTPKTSVPEYWNGSIPWLSVADFNNVPRWVTSTEKHITKRGLEESSTKLLSAGDIIISARGTVGEIAQLARPMTFNQSCYGIRGVEGISNTDYVFYALKFVVEQLKRLAHGAVFDTITRDTFNTVDVLLPTLNEQIQIASLLGALDDRITLLRETNQTQEAIAQALFKSWFVDFDPVRAKAGVGLPDGMDEVTASLFPDSFEMSAIGEVPSGWQTLPFLDACDLLGGSQPPAATFIDKPKDGYVRLLQIRDFSTDAHKTYIPETNKLKKVTEDDVLIGRYGSASGDKAKDSLGRVCRGLGGSYNVALMKLNPLLVGREFAYQLVVDPRFYNYLQGVSSKAVQSGFSKSELGQYQVVLPSSEISLKFEQIGVAVWESVKANNQKIKTLTKLRKTLLPRLISGQLRIADAEAGLEKAIA